MKIISAHHDSFEATPFYVLTDSQYEHIMRGYEVFYNMHELLGYLESFECYNTQFISTEDDITLFEHTQQNKIVFNFAESE
jgi:hypothetical protein